MEAADSIFKISLLIYLVTLIIMYLHLVKIDRKTSVYPVNICSNYAAYTKKEKGKIDLLYYVNQLSGIVAILSIVVPFALSLF